MRTKDRVILAAGVVIVLGGIALLAWQMPEPLPEEAIRNSLGGELGLTPRDTLRIAAPSGDFIRLNLHGAEGGGMWALASHGHQHPTYRQGSGMSDLRPA